MAGVLVKRENLDTKIDMYKGRLCEKTQGEDSHPQTKEKEDLEHILPSEPLEGTILQIPQFQI